MLVGLASISGFIGVGISSTHFHQCAPKYVDARGFKRTGLSLKAKALAFVTGTIKIALDKMMLTIIIACNIKLYFHVTYKRDLLNFFK